MSADFEWQTEDDEQLLRPVSGPGGLSAGFRLWPFLLLFSIGLLAGVIYWRLDQRLDRQGSLLEQEVMAAGSLWRRAVVSGDKELLSAVAMHADYSWYSLQQQLLAQGEILDRPFFGLQLAESQVASPEVSLSSNWLRAEAVFELAYEGGATGRSLYLRQTAVFQRQGERWLLAPPGDDFWGAELEASWPLLTMSFPARDAGLLERLGQELAAELAAACRQMQQGACLPSLALNLQWARDPAVMLQMTADSGLVFRGQTIVLPTPTLVGIPADEAAYQVIYDAYAGPILDQFTDQLAVSLVSTGQVLHLICFQDGGRIPELFAYDPLTGAWSSPLPGLAFRFLSPAADDSALVLQQLVRGGDPARMRLLLWRDRQSTVLFDQNFNRLLLNPVGWSAAADGSRILLHGYVNDPSTTRYTEIDPQQCDDLGCLARELDGFPLWSPDGRRSLLLQRGTVYLGDETGRSVLTLEQGLTLFWLGADRYGYVRFHQSASELAVELITAAVDDNRPQVLLDSTVLADALNDGRGGPIFIEYVLPRPGHPDQLLLKASQFDIGQTWVHLFLVQLDEVGGRPPRVEALTQLATLDSPPVGYPSLAAASGYVPFQVSPDGRWLSLVDRVDAEEEGWTLTLIDLDELQTEALAVSYPDSNFRHPYYDWSADGRWLAVVEDGFLRLYSPLDGDEKQVRHDYLACSHTAWLDEAGSGG